MTFYVTNFELWLCLILFLAAFSFYLLYYLRSKIKYTKDDNKNRKKNKIVACKTLAIMMIGVAAVGIVLLFSM